MFTFLVVGLHYYQIIMSFVTGDLKIASKIEKKKLLKSSSFVEFGPKMKQITRGKSSSFIKFGPKFENISRGMCVHHTWAINYLRLKMHGITWWLAFIKMSLICAVVLAN